MPNISFGYPQALFLLLLLPVVLFLARPNARRFTTRAMMRRRNRRASVVIRLLIVTLLVLTISDIQLITQSDRLATVFLLDSSDSVGPGGKRQGVDYIRESSKTMKDNQEMGVVVFGQDALIEKPVNKDRLFENPSNAPGTNYTNIAEAVRLGTSMLPSDSQRRLILVSDGNQNLDEVRNAAKLAAAAGVQIDVLPVDRVDGPEMSIASINVPNNLREGEQFSLTISVDSNFDGPAKLFIFQQNQVISEVDVNVKKGNNTFTQPLKANSKGFVNYTARIIPAKDTLDQNNETNAYSLVKGKPRVLMVDGHPDEKEAANLENALKAADIETETITADKFPGLTELAQYDSLILVDVPGTTLTPANMSTIQTYVKNVGKGLIMVGGEESYGLGGYFRTPIEEMLPVELQLPNKLQSPSVAMVLVIDRSGSMADAYNGPGAGASGIPKIELAKDAAYLATTQLNNTDQVGVVAFDTAAQWVVNLSPMGSPANLVSSINRVAPGGGTAIYTGIVPAIEELKKVTAQNKHIIVLTDGVDSDNFNYDALIAEAAKNNITVSTIGLGEDVDDKKLNNIAKVGGGRYYFVNDPGNLPKIFTKEARLAYRNYIVEEPFVPVINAPSPILRGISATPKLLGYVGTKSRPLATTALVSERGDPILAHWQNGLGRVVAWTSDAKSRWSSEWLNWNDFPRFWAQTVRWTIAENDTGGLQVSTKTVGNRVVVTADALTSDSQYLNGLEVKASVVNSNQGSGGNEEISLTQTAPGHYEGSFVPKNTGSYIVNVQGGEGLSGSTTTGNGNSVTVGNLSQTVGAVASYSPEYKQLGTNRALLEEIAGLTGGRVLTSPAEAFSNDLQRTNRSQPLWPWLLALLLLLFPLDIGIRRVNLSPRALLQGFKKREEPAIQAETLEAESYTTPEVSRLFEAKERVGARTGAAVKEAPAEVHIPGQVVSSGGSIGAPPIHQNSATRTFVPPTVAEKDKSNPFTPKPNSTEDKVQVAPPEEVEEETTYSAMVRKFNRYDNLNTEKTDTIIPKPSLAPEQPKPEPAPQSRVQPAPPTEAASTEAAPPPTPRVAPRSAPDKVPEAGDEEGGMTGRLLRAKRRVYEDRTKKDDEKEPEQ